MNITIQPGSVSGKIKAPPSKSSMQRACAAALINDGTTTISDFGDSNDERAAIRIITELGAKVRWENDSLIISSSDEIFDTVNEQKKIINCGESGLSIRMFAPLAALFKSEITFTGEGSILKRPMNFFEDIFPELAVKISTNQGKPPLVIHGPLQPREITVDGSLSSQFLTGLLFAFAKSCKEPVSIWVNNLQSRPYIDLTLAVLEHFGFKVTNDHYENFTLFPREKNVVRMVDFKVEGDWSNVAFLLVAAAISGELSLSGIDRNSTQGDKKIMEALRDCGAFIKETDDTIFIRKQQLNPFQFDAQHCPDLFPPLVTLASYCNGVSVIKGVSRLLHKESNRGITLQNEFEKLGVKIDLEGDIMLIHGGGKVKGATVSSNNDHRIAMACAIAALGSDGAIEIENSEAVNKSYPGFFEDLKAITQ